MANEHGLFWDSYGGDRLYNAESMEEWLKPFFVTGVFNGHLQVTANEGMTVSVAPGYCNVEGKVKYFDVSTVLTLDPSSGTARTDNIVIERNDGDRTISLKVVKNGGAPVRESGVYQLVLAEISIAADATSITQANILDTRWDSELCGYVVSTVDEVDFDQMAAQFNDWFVNFKSHLDGDIAANLQLEIDELQEHVDVIPELEEEVYDAKTLQLPAPLAFKSNIEEDYLLMSVKASKITMIPATNSFIPFEDNGDIYCAIAYPNNSLLRIILAKWQNNCWKSVLTYGNLDITPGYVSCYFKGRIYHVASIKSGSYTIMKIVCIYKNTNNQWTYTHTDYPSGSTYYNYNATCFFMNLDNLYLQYKSASSTEYAKLSGTNDWTQITKIDEAVIPYNYNDIDTEDNIIYPKGPMTSVNTYSNSISALTKKDGVNVIMPLDGDIYLNKFSNNSSSYYNNILNNNNLSALHHNKAYYLQNILNAPYIQIGNTNYVPLLSNHAFVAEKNKFKIKKLFSYGKDENIQKGNYFSIDLFGSQDILCTLNSRMVTLNPYSNNYEYGPLGISMEVKIYDNLDDYVLEPSEIMLADEILCSDVPTRTVTHCVVDGDFYFTRGSYNTSYSLYKINNELIEGESVIATPISLGLCPENMSLVSYKNNLYGLSENRKLYKYTNGAWSVVVSDVGVTWYCHSDNDTSNSQYKIVADEDYIHIFSTNYHRLFDGNTITNAVNLPLANANLSNCGITPDGVYVSMRTKYTADGYENLNYIYCYSNSRREYTQVKTPTDVLDNGLDMLVDDNVVYLNSYEGRYNIIPWESFKGNALVYARDRLAVKYQYGFNALIRTNESSAYSFYLIKYKGVVCLMNVDRNGYLKFYRFKRDTEPIYPHTNEHFSLTRRN